MRRVESVLINSLIASVYIFQNESILLYTMAWILTSILVIACIIDSWHLDSTVFEHCDFDAIDITSVLFQIVAVIATIYHKKYGLGAITGLSLIYWNYAIYVRQYNG